jgi:putative membrane protein
MSYAQKLIKTKYFINFFIGYLIGAANTMPGLSGGSIAYILGVYERLVESLSNIKPEMFFSLANQKKRNIFFQNLDLSFLLSILLGALLGLFSFSAIMPFFVSNYPDHMNALFLGLLITAIPYNIFNKLSLKHLLLLILITISTVVLTQVKPLTLINGPLYQFLSGMLAITAMLLPGISGSFILVLFGNYHYIFTQINQLIFLDWQALVNLFPFLTGALFGVLLFLRIINFCLINFYKTTNTILLGILIGSFPALWPFTDQSNKKIFIPESFDLDLLFKVYLFLLGCLITFFSIRRINTNEN